jgi:hypothetical protein
MYLQIAIAEAQPVRFVIPGVIQENFFGQDLYSNLTGFVCFKKRAYDTMLKPVRLCE